METTATVSKPKITQPADKSKHDFGQPLLVRWSDNGAEVIRYRLCVGTARGKWDIFNDEVRKSTEQTIDLSKIDKLKLANIHTLYLQLLFTAKDPTDPGGQVFLAERIEVRRG